MFPALFFFRRFLKRPRQISSLIPTSSVALKHLAARITKPGRLVIVEYGPGTGGLAQEILRRENFSKDSLLILLEIDVEFVRFLRRTIHDPRVRIVHDSAENIRAVLRHCGEEKADYIFSSIPLSLMPEETVDRILRETQSVLRDDGACIVFVVRETRQLLERFFPRVTVQFLAANIPPLIVHEARL